MTGTGLSTTARLAAAAILIAALLGGASLSSAQVFPNGRDSGFNERDEVTGYLCVTPTCDVVRLPNASCICTKQNPGERRLSKLRLACSTKKGGQWVSCPVKPRYGISVN